MKKSGTTKIDSDLRPKIRLGFDSSIGAHRQLLVTADTNTTNQFDIGYDAPMFDTNNNDVFWDFSNNQFVIQAVPDFNTNQVLPLTIVVANKGEVTLKIDELENVPSNTNIYLFDAQTETYHDLRETAFKISLDTGDSKNRFSIRFTNKTLDVEDFNLSENIQIYFTNNNKILNIENNFMDGTVTDVFLFNMLGQSIANWDVKERKQTNIQIPIKNRPSGVYIVKLKTTKGDFSKKIIIR
jgi:hypothetical protein